MTDRHLPLLRSLGVGLLVLTASWTLGCPKKPVLSKPGPNEAPLEKSIQVLGLSLDDLALPRSVEAGYQIPTQSPALDAALARPLALPPRAEAVGIALDEADSPTQILAATRSLSPRGSAEPAPPSSAPRSDRPIAPPPTELIDSEKGKLLLGHLPEDFVSNLRALCAALELAEAGLHQCQAEGRLRAPARAAEEFFVEAWGGTSRYRNHPTGVQREFLEHAASIDLPCVHAQTEALLGTLEELLPGLKASTKKLPASGGNLLNIETSLGPIVVGGLGTDKHSQDAALLIDPGGDDAWSNNAGSNLGLRSPLSVAIDLGGNDSYSCERSYCQGAGYGGVGILIDVGEGNDDYFAGSQAQGAGFLGVGVLWDQGGDDAYQADSYGQGAGTLGLGLLLDGGGNDRAVIRARGQGFGATGGLGILSDLSGNDQRRLGLSAAPVHGPLSGGGQGGAWGTRSFPWLGTPSLHGGVGLLYDRAGSDGYYARAFGQGAAWFLSMGLLLDRAGDDHYIAEWFGQGAGIHLAAGLLLDGGGSDVYEGTNTVQAAAMDRSLGVLWDRGKENDTYRVAPVGGALQKELGGGQAWARQAHALAVLVDEGGDDNYTAGWDGLGFSVAPARPDQRALALLVDLAGKDIYSLGHSRAGATPADGATWVQDWGGMGMDTASTRPGWEQSSGASPPSLPFSYSPGGTNEFEIPGLPEGNLEGDATARWAALEAAARERSVDGATEDPVGVEAARRHALNDPDPSVRRSAARLLFAQGELEGLDILIDSLVFRSEETWRPGAISSLPYWLSVATGIPADSDEDGWREGWKARQAELDPAAALQRTAVLDRALLTASRGDLDQLVATCTEAIDQELDAVSEPCGQLVGLWAWVLGHPESAERHDPARAVELGQLAVQWTPNQAEHFVNLARAFHAEGNTELALSALEKATLLDPDDPALLVLQRVLDDAAGP